MAHQITASRIAELNDTFRRDGVGGSQLITSGIQAEGFDFVNKVVAAVRAFDAFNSGNDPYGHHDFGSLTVEGIRVFWKIDCYDQNMIYGSEDPTDPAKTHRVLTIMLPSEY